MNTQRKARYAVFFAALAFTMRLDAFEPELLTRSLYLPIEFDLCEHLDHGMLYENDVLVSAMPVKRIFQFTYYPDLERIAPDFVRVRVEGSYEDGEPFLAKLAVARDGVHTSHRSVAGPADEELQKQLRRKRDVRFEPRRVVLSCTRFCQRKQADGENP